ncbi:MAG: DNA polymerase III subunit gamma/tau [Acidobacteria bacterium]|nr:DNA polymerase III subunit gamma/tau [Acidobacteriota bacterium]
MATARFRLGRRSGAHRHRFAQRVAHAYLFSGIRGVGKTSVARILAKALNCERGSENGPCNECATCAAIDAGSSLDILEIDAATHSKVEQVRELTENLLYKPVHAPYKIVVLDEVHRLSRQAFDALLKIIEEPPSHLVFIFATTELESVPATILSRCQEFNFRRVPRQLMVDHLARVAASEEIGVGENTLRLIARASEGSVRDAVALLDQLATYGSGTIADDEAGRILGGVNAALHHKLLAAVIDGESQVVVGIVGEVEEEGWDPRHVYGEFLSYCRDVLHLALGGSTEELDLPDDAARAASELASAAGYENLLRLLQQLLASEEAVRRSETGLLAVEIAWLRGAELPRLTQIETLLGEAPPTATASGTLAPQPPPSAQDRSAADLPADPATDAAPASGPQPETGPAPVPEPPAPALEPAPTSERPVLPSETAQLLGVDGFLELISRRRQVIAAHLKDVRDIAFADGCLTVVTAPGDEWLELALQRDTNREAFETCLENAFGPGARWRIQTGSVDSQQSSEPAASAEAGAVGAKAVPSSDPLLQHPTVQAALDVFGGTAEAIDEASS